MFDDLLGPEKKDYNSEKIYDTKATEELVKQSIAKDEGAMEEDPWATTDEDCEPDGCDDCGACEPDDDGEPDGCDDCGACDIYEKICDEDDEDYYDENEWDDDESDDWA